MQQAETFAKVETDLGDSEVPFSIVCSGNSRSEGNLMLPGVNMCQICPNRFSD